jgi:hypothetical protein
MYAATITNISSRAIVEFCASRGVPSERLLAAAGIPAEQISEPRARISAERVFALWEEGQKATHDALIAEHVAGLVPFGAYAIGDSRSPQVRRRDKPCRSSSGHFPWSMERLNCS